MKSSKFFVIVSDANVLIDFLSANEEVLNIASTTIFEIHVPVPVLREIKQLSETKAKRLGIKLLEPTVEQLTESVSGSPRLSFEDNLCLRIAKDNGWICATNDKVLKRECEKFKVHTMWGLEIMLALNHAGHLLKKDAIKTAEKICEVNLRLAEKVVEDFIKKLR